MPTIKSIRFQKIDDYQNPVFIANSTKEPTQYKKLSRFYEQLSEEYKDSFLPLFENKKHKYATIRLKKDTQVSQLKLTANDVVDIKFTVRKRVSEEGKISVNCHLESIKLVQRAPPVDLGQEITFSDSEEENTAV